ncbi:uncharacterized protein LOC110441188 isoform X2 [Mizuhopecten yessoensis]|uniref:uncharacterized protein LOC110441188 isoform X2 n=1 Tax=Mizuhopecten yessoensis TaxID=6573 RepID=UPI000B45F6D0|nr:uncharacterized protein LOC110441188 isoform X2 [Mizuhopecten yessoensis]
MRSGDVTPVDFSSDGSPVSTPGNSPYGSVNDLSKIDDSQNGNKKAVTGQSDNPSGPLLQLPGQSDSYKHYGSNRKNNEDKDKDLHDVKISETSTDIDRVTLQKEYGIGLGVSLLRRDTNGFSHIYIQDIAQGSVADKDGQLRKGDMIVKAGGRSLQDITLLDAYQVFRTLLAGPVTLLIRRGIKFKPRTIHLSPNAAGQLITNYEKEQGLDMLTEEARCQPCYLPSEGTICQPCYLPSEGTICQPCKPPSEGTICQPCKPSYEGSGCRSGTLKASLNCAICEPLNLQSEGPCCQTLNLPLESVSGQPSNPPICQPYGLMPAQLITDGLSLEQSLNEDDFLV